MYAKTKLQEALEEQKRAYEYTQSNLKGDERTSAAVSIGLKIKDLQRVLLLINLYGEEAKND